MDHSFSSNAWLCSSQTKFGHNAGMSLHGWSHSMSMLLSTLILLHFPCLSSSTQHPIEAQLPSRIAAESSDLAVLANTLILRQGRKMHCNTQHTIVQMTSASHVGACSGTWCNQSSTEVDTGRHPWVTACDSSHSIMIPKVNSNAILWIIIGSTSRTFR